MPEDVIPGRAIDLVDLKTRFGFKGLALAASDAGFAEAAVGELWNKRQPSRHPQVIVHVSDEQDVVAAVRFARAHGLKVAVRGGGHNWCCPSRRDNGLLIDLSNLNVVRLSFAPANWQRLAELRQKHDPDGLFFDFTEGLVCRPPAPDRDGERRARPRPLPSALEGARYL
jgi:hypothetical protein